MMSPQAPAVLPPQPRQTSGLAITSLICGVASFVLLVIPAIVAIICGHVARSRIKKSHGALQGKGLALAGLICGYASLFLITATITTIVYNVNESKRVKAEQVAEEIRRGKEIHQLLLKYEADHGHFPPTLQELEDKGYCPSIKSLQTIQGKNWTYYHSQSSKSDPNMLILWGHDTDVIIYVDGTTDRAQSYSAHMTALSRMRHNDYVNE
ncbi:MAG: DUF4190 domain-containing protein [Akkermansiaceae bacterium]|nr:DUF4190 domain-containing protein [Akkermansiaceae bacterium]